MSGHSKWSTIKRKKGAADQARGRLFTKLTKEISVAARLGGGDPAGNPRLRLAIQAAKKESMPNDNITRAIKKGTGELEGGSIDELVYEGYGPGGVAFIMDVATDNVNRTYGEVRNLFTKHGGSIAKPGAVAFQFDRRGLIRFDGEAVTEERVMEAALEAGAEDVQTEDGSVVVYTNPNDLHGVNEAMSEAGLEAEEAKITMIPSASVEVTDEQTVRTTLKLLEKLEDHDDVQSVWANFDIPDELLERVDQD